MHDNTHELKVLMLDASTGFCHMQRYRVGDFSAPWIWGIHLAFKHNALTIGAGLLAGGCNPGAFHLRVDATGRQRPLFRRRHFCRGHAHRPADLRKDCGKGGDSMADIWLGLFSGVAFGFVIQRIGAIDAYRMARSHLMLDADIPRFMVLAVALSDVGIFGLQSVGVGRTLPLPTSIVATGLAAVIMHNGHGRGNPALAQAAYGKIRPAFRPEVSPSDLILWTTLVQRHINKVNKTSCRHFPALRDLGHDSGNGVFTPCLKTGNTFIRYPPAIRGAEWPPGR